MRTVYLWLWLAHVSIIALASYDVAEQAHGEPTMIWASCQQLALSVLYAEIRVYTLRLCGFENAILLCITCCQNSHQSCHMSSKTICLFHNLP